MGSRECVDVQAHTTHNPIHTPHKPLPLATHSFQGCVHWWYGYPSGEQIGEEAYADPRCTLSVIWVANSMVLGFQSVIQKVGRVGAMWRGDWGRARTEPKAEAPLAEIRVVCYTHTHKCTCIRSVRQMVIHPIKFGKLFWAISNQCFKIWCKSWWVNKLTPAINNTNAKPHLKMMNRITKPMNLMTKQALNILLRQLLDNYF